MLFNDIADAVEDKAKLGAQIIGTAHRTQNMILNATGVNSIIPSPVKHITDSIYRANQKFVLDAGRTSAAVLRKIEYVDIS